MSFAVSCLLKLEVWKLSSGTALIAEVSDLGVLAVTSSQKILLSG